ncbi:MarR family transcriptional regulator [Paenibacillus sp. H1-7]|uniref:MarR family winged helix-turn-helix transcriptional regulator n=1 Tax=Paenibacillus sp. H1-7 TaxID=2282849 RepID=UPI001EF88D0E|nr:MarR family transcriptional regulator [Paenibacillus sp. H1-7]
MSSTNSLQTERFEKALWGAARKLGPEMVADSSIPLTRQQLFMLYFISNKGICKVTELAETMEVKPSAVTVMIDRLIKRGVAERKYDPKDRRIVLIELTEQGRNLLQEFKEKRKHIIGSYLSNIDPERLDIFLDVFEHILDNIMQSHATESTL